jgi:hypothetical protein
MLKNVRNLAIILLICISTAAKAQNFNSGIRLGANFSQIDGDHMSGYNRAGIVGGIFVCYPFKGNWEGQFEMLFSQKGSEMNDSVLTGDWELLRIDYIEVPVMMNYRLNKKVKFNFGLGGAYMIGNYFIGKNNVYQTNVEWIKKGEFNGTVGVQYYFTPKLSIFGRFTYSLLGINKQGSQFAYYVYDGGMANNIISFGAYYSFLNAK